MSYFFTWQPQRDAKPSVTAKGGRDVWIIDEAGDEWLDLGSLSYQANLGYSQPAIIDAITRQAQTLAFAGPNFDYAAKRELAAKLIDLAPAGFSRVFFTIGGAEANENAAKMAYTITGRPRFVARQNGYHGATLGALALTGDYRRKPFLPLLMDVTHVPDCPCVACEAVLGREGDASAACGDNLAAAFAKDTPAALFLEPVPGANGVRVPSPNFFARARALCDAHDTLLICDEVLTGFGRTGEMLAIENWSVTPDLICISKGLTGGYAPLGAVLVRDSIAEHYEDNMLSAGLTHYAHPLGCAAACAAIDLYDELNVLENVRALAPGFDDAIKAMASLPGISAPRSIGLLAAIDVEAPPQAWNSIADGLRERRILTHVYPARGTILFAPPLTIASDVLTAGLSQVTEVMTKVLG